MAAEETDPDLPVSVQESPGEVWVGRGLLQCRGTECSSARMGTFEGGLCYLHRLHHTLALGKQHEGTQPWPSTENWIKVLLSTAPPIRTRFSFPHSQSLPPGNFHKPLILSHQRADRMKTTVTEN